MKQRQTKESEWMAIDQLLGSVSWGVNRPQIFLKLCQAYRHLNLDIVDVDSHVSKGWFCKMIIARNRNKSGFHIGQLTRRINRVSDDLGFTSKCFMIPDSAQTSEIEANVVIVLQSENRTGFLADILEHLSKHNIDIVDIDTWMDQNERNCALNIHVYVPTEPDSFFLDIKKIRDQLSEVKQQWGPQTFNFMVHSSETFDFIEKIDFEKRET